MATQSKTTPKGPITLHRLEDNEISIPVLGLSPLIPHRWSEKAKTMMLDKQQAEGRTPRAKKAPKDPKAEAHAATYWLDDGTPGMPATAFKAAMVDACRFFDAVTMTDIRRMLYVVGTPNQNDELLVPIFGELSFHEDTPRNATGVADLRYRNYIWPWRTVLTVRFPPTVISAESILALVDAGGRSGVGDWRPSSPKSNTGTHGTFRVAETND